MSIAWKKAAGKSVRGGCKLLIKKDFIFSRVHGQALKLEHGLMLRAQHFPYFLSGNI
jgi:hypothetical protein